MMDQKRPDGTVHGHDPKDAGKRTGVTDTYGGNINTGYNQAPMSITGDTKSNPANEKPGCNNKRGK